MNKRSKAARIYEILSKEYEDACCTLKFENPHQFLFANILSPQTTDEAVNKISHKLCSAFETTRALAEADLEEIQSIIKPLGFYKVKSRYIKESAQLLVNKFKGELPSDIKQLQEFTGIGRKTALVILKVVFDKIEGIIIDTHNIRIVNRIGFVDTDDTDRIEETMMKLLPKDIWGQWSDLMVFHGRALCTAQNPECSECPILKHCNYGQSNI